MKKGYMSVLTMSLLTVAAVYLVIVMILSYLVGLLERSLRKSDH